MFFDLPSDHLVERKRSSPAFSRKPRCGRYSTLPSSNALVAACCARSSSEGLHVSKGSCSIRLSDTVRRFRGWAVALLYRALGSGGVGHVLRGLRGARAFRQNLAIDR